MADDDRPGSTSSGKRDNGNVRRLVIVESPTKARKIAGYLGRNYVVESSRGHIRDLPKGAMVDVSLLIGGTVTGTWEAGIVFSVDNGRSWRAGLISTNVGGSTPKFGVPNYALVGPSLTIASGSPVITLDIVGGES